MSQPFPRSISRPSPLSHQQARAKSGRTGPPIIQGRLALSWRQQGSTGPSAGERLSRKVSLIYIDPPFDSGADYVRKVQLRGVSGTAKLDGESYTLGEQIQYTDIWANDNYLQFMYERLLLLKELLAENGSLYLHCDWNKSHHLRTVLDEVFGTSSLLNEIIWQRISAHPDSTYFGHVHDTLFLYAKDPSQVAFHTLYSRTLKNLSNVTLRETTMMAEVYIGQVI